MTHAFSNIRGLRNIYIIDAQFSGKITLVSALTFYFDIKFNLTWKAVFIKRPQIFKEVARQIFRKHKFTGQDVSESQTRVLELQTFILKAQYRAENAVEASWFISDRSGVDAIIYGKKYAGETGAEKLLAMKEWKKLENSYMTAFFLFRLH